MCSPQSPTVSMNLTRGKGRIRVPRCKKLSAKGNCPQFPGHVATGKSPYGHIGAVPHAQPSRSSLRSSVFSGILLYRCFCTYLLRLGELMPHGVLYLAAPIAYELEARCCHHAMYACIVKNISCLYRCYFSLHQDEYPPHICHVVSCSTWGTESRSSSVWIVARLIKRNDRRRRQFFVYYPVECCLRCSTSLSRKVCYSILVLNSK